MKIAVIILLVCVTGVLVEARSRLRRSEDAKKAAMLLKEARDAAAPSLSSVSDPTESDSAPSVSDSTESDSAPSVSDSTESDSISESSEPVKK